MKIAVILSVALIIVVGLASAGILLAQRSAFREKMRPLVEEDLSDFAADMGASGTLMVGEAMSKREKRIPRVRLFGAGHYNHARDLIAHLMEAENSFLAMREEYSEIPDKIENDSTQLKLTEARMEMVTDPSLRTFRTESEMCEVGDDFLSLGESSLADFRVASSAQKVADGSRLELIELRDALYGWIRWLGLDIQADNPLRSIRPFTPLVTDKSIQTWKHVEEAIVHLRSSLSKKGCRVLH